MFITALRPYFPSIFLISLALFFLALPFFAVLLVVGVLVFLSVTYGWVVHKLQRAKSYQIYEEGQTFTSDETEPRFKDVVIVMKKKANEMNRWQ